MGVQVLLRQHHGRERTEPRIGDAEELRLHQAAEEREGLPRLWQDVRGTADRQEDVQPGMLLLPPQPDAHGTRGGRDHALENLGEGERPRHDGAWRDGGGAGLPKGREVRHQRERHRLGANIAGGRAVRVPQPQRVGKEELPALRGACVFRAHREQHPIGTYERQEGRDGEADSPWSVIAKIADVTQEGNWSVHYNSTLTTAGSGSQTGVTSFTAASDKTDLVSGESFTVVFTKAYVDTLTADTTISEAGAFGTWHKHLNTEKGPGN